jgi:hypothetical protein
MEMILNGANCFLHQEHHRVDEGKVTPSCESFVVDAVLVAKGLLQELAAAPVEGFLDPTRGMRVLLLKLRRLTPLFFPAAMALWALFQFRE